MPPIQCCTAGKSSVPSPTWQVLLWLQFYLIVVVFLLIRSERLEKNFALDPFLLKFLENLPLFYSSWRCYSSQTNKQFVELCLLDCDLCLDIVFVVSFMTLAALCVYWCNGLSRQFVSEQEQLMQTCLEQNRATEIPELTVLGSDFNVWPCASSGLNEPLQIKFSWSVDMQSTVYGWVFWYIDKCFGGMV